MSTQNQTTVHSMADELGSRLAKIRDTSDPSSPLFSELVFFAEHAIKLERTIDKLSRISDTMQAQILEQRQELEQLNRQKIHFFTLLAHDLRSPLHHLVKVASKLKGGKDPVNPQREEEIIDVLLSTGEHITGLVDNLFAWAKLQMDTTIISPQLLPVPFLLTRLREQFAAPLEEKALSLEIDSKPLNVYADAQMTQSILRNLLSNAIKFTPCGGTIRLCVHRQETSIALEIADNGVGIREAHIPNLFDVAVKTHTLGTEDERGSGLGLPLCAEMASRQHGHIEVHSREGEGSVFTLLLPEAPA